jgi:hypothetical protein
MATGLAGRSKRVRQKLKPAGYKYTSISEMGMEMSIETHWVIENDRPSVSFGSQYQAVKEMCHRCPQLKGRPESEIIASWRLSDGRDYRRETSPAGESSLTAEAKWIADNGIC